MYLAVLVLLATALISTFLSFNTIITRNKTERELSQSANLVLERIARSVRGADSVSTGLSVFDVSPGRLTLVESGTTTSFYVSSSTLMLSVNGIVKGPLTSGTISVERVIFTRYVGSTTEMIRVSLVLDASSDTASSTRTFYTSAILRGLYE